MKWNIFLRAWNWLHENMDDLSQVKKVLEFIVFVLVGWIPTMKLMAAYGIIPDYGFFAIFGQCLSYVARFLNPKLFPKQDEYTTATKWMRFGGNVLLAWTFGVFTTPIAFKYFEPQTISIVAVSILVGAFYDLILRPLISAAYQASNYLNRKWTKFFESDLPTKTDEIK